jgi:hypothetical protein
MLHVHTSTRENTRHVNKRKVRMGRLVLRRDADRSFDLAFWRRIGAEGRFAAMWQMVKEV